MFVRYKVTVKNLNGSLNIKKKLVCILKKSIINVFYLWHSQFMEKFNVFSQLVLNIFKQKKSAKTFSKTNY